MNSYTFLVFLVSVLAFLVPVGLRWVEGVDTEEWKDKRFNDWLKRPLPTLRKYDIRVEKEWMDWAWGIVSQWEYPHSARASLLDWIAGQDQIGQYSDFEEWYDKSSRRSIGTRVHTDWSTQKHELVRKLARKQEYARNRNPYLEQRLSDAVAFIQKLQ